LNATSKSKSVPASDEPHAPSFENALRRIEEILELINSGTMSLEDSIRLYQEADKLIALCTSQLNEAEQKVEILIKNRQGEPVLNAEQKPVVENFSPTLNPSNPQNR
jgi:exodeoxyribonuclease VII small subunit